MELPDALIAAGVQSGVAALDTGGDGDTLDAGVSLRVAI